MAFLKGAVWGIVIGGVGLAGVSLVAPQPVGDGPSPRSTATADTVVAPETAAGTAVAPRAAESSADDAPATGALAIDTPATAAPATDTAVDTPATGTAVSVPVLTDGPTITPPAASVAAPSRVAVGDRPDSRPVTPAEPVAPVAGTQPVTADPNPATPPQAGAAVVTPSPPRTDAVAVSRPIADAAVLPNPQAIAPAIPAPEADIVIGTDPAPTPGTARVTVIDDDATGTDAASGQAALVEVLPEAAAPPLVITTPDAAPPPQAPDTPTASAPTSDDPTSDDLTSDDLTSDDQTPDGPAQTTPTPDDAAPAGTATVTVTTQDRGAAVPPASAARPVTAGADPVPGADVAASVDAAPATSSGPATDATAAGRPAVTALIDTPSQGLPGGTDGVVVRRPAPAQPLPTDESAPEAQAEADPAPVVSALVQYGAFHDNALDLPLMSVVILDDGSLTDGAQLLADVPFAVTVLLDPADPAAAARMADYTAAGIEVAALAAFPAGATPADAAVTLEATFAALPRAVAVVDIGATPLDADVTDRIVTDLAASGRGLVVPDQGLNSGLRAAADAFVPATTIYRDLDANGQDARVIRRFVDEAAFRARQQSGIVLLGRLRPDTISALILWGSAARADDVSLAPLSATLLALPQG